MSTKEKEKFGGAHKKAKLTYRDKAFIRAYLKEPVLYKAAIAAGYSAKNASVYAGQIIRKPLVKAYLEKLDAKKEQLAVVDAAWVLRESKRKYDAFEKLNTMDLQQLYDDKGALKPIQEWPEELRQLQAIREINTEDIFTGRGQDRKLVGYARKIKTADLTAIQKQHLELIGKHTSVRAFDQSEPSGAQLGNVTLKIVYVDNQALPAQEPTRRVTAKAE